jgi:hypothetical protein
MIHRYQRALFYFLLGSILTMAVFLFYERQQFRERLNARIDATPLLPPSFSAATEVTLDLARDSDGTIAPVERKLALPEEPSVKARALIDRLMVEYALPRSDHPLPEGIAVEDVFMVKMSTMSNTPEAQEGGQLAVIDLRGSFLDQHPSGLEAEMLSLLSMLGTLHQNFPDVYAAQFLVDGRVRDTIAGHADLRRMYPAIDTTVGVSELQPAP